MAIFKVVLSDTDLENSENDSKRSNFIFKLFQNVTAINNRRHLGTALIPRKIVQFWDKVNGPPEDVKKCMASWKQLENEGYTYTLFNEKMATDYIALHLSREHLIAFNNCYHPAMKSDYFRLCYIYCEGGMYVDADDIYTGLKIDIFFKNNKLKLQPFCYNTDTNKMVSTPEFLKKATYSKNWIYYFNNNPIISPPYNPVICYALERATKNLTKSGKASFPEIQTTAGPGNISASIVATTSMNTRDFELLTEWDKWSETVWHLSYRNDSRNWRLSNQKSFK